MFNIICSVGITSCTPGIANIYQAGNFIAWHEAISAAGLIITALQFIEMNRLRRYVVRLSYLYDALLFLTGFSVVSSLFSYLISVVSHPTTIPLIGYPAFYEVISLLMLTAAFLLVLAALLFPKKFVRLNTQLLKKINKESLRNLDTESYDALTRIIHSHLPSLIERISKDDKYSPPKLSKKEKDFILQGKVLIDVTLTGQGFMKYIAENDIGFIVNIIKLAEEHNLWDSSCGYGFFSGLAEELFSNENSLMSRERHYGGPSGVYKDVTNTLFKSRGVISHYGVFSYMSSWGQEVSLSALENWIEGLKISLRDYYSEKLPIRVAGTPNLAISGSVKKLSDCLINILDDINRTGESYWESPLRKKQRLIVQFFGSLENLLSYVDDRYDKYAPLFSSEELKVEKYAVSEGIAEAVFEILWQVGGRSEDEEGARRHLLDIFWLSASGASPSPLIEAIKGKVATLVKERLERNMENQYVSLIRPLLNLYGFRLVNAGNSKDNKVFSTFQKFFWENIYEKLLNSVDFRKEHLPSNWNVSAGVIYMDKERERPLEKKIS